MASLNIFKIDVVELNIFSRKSDALMDRFNVRVIKGVVEYEERHHLGPVTHHLSFNFGR